MTKKLTVLGMLSISLFSFAQQKFSIIPSVGYAWRTAEIPKGISSEQKDYLKGLKSGVNFDISAYYHLKNEFAIGLKYSNYSASSSARLIFQDVNGSFYSGNINTKDHITFFGPSVMYSNYNEDIKHKLFADLGLGVISYVTKTGTVKGTGSSFGMEANFGYQYALTKNFFMGPKVGFTAGTLTKMKFNGQVVDFEDNQREGLHRVSLSAAATFRF
ncbi:outer membrane beta-barrel protein [Chryseobacterium fistulae]|uniref:Uncharacterized protein n=1 Tax=Chryseobacterium fistulae TaxID=2675058 RepID=A0A6N4XVK4_9FLAO|nr:outer membrane beta-barrel protein [Chryseobacterium fistulae]CAA7390177.1 hypothetical protein CHRY9393_02476 [Chryseobacterium fistulae]